MIDSYRFGRISVNGTAYSRDLIIYPDRVDAPWWRREGHTLDVDDILEVADEQPEVLIVGTGSMGRMDVPQSVREHVKRLGVRLVVANTPKAVQEYNRLSQSSRVVAALHLTC